jgi:DNA polymerase III alpha subunit
LTRGVVHLHIRSGFSYSFERVTPEELVEALSGLGMDALALTEKNDVYGVPRFLKAAEEPGIRPAVGAVSTMEGGGYEEGRIRTRG